MIPNEDIVTRIKELCTERGWTIYRLAKESGISHSTLNHVISKNSIPKMETFRKICESLGLTPDEFLEYEQPDEYAITKSQSELLGLWNQLDQNNKEFAKKFICFLLSEQSK